MEEVTGERAGLDYIAELAEQVRLQLGGTASPPALLRTYALLVVTTGAQTTRENAHDAWAAWRGAVDPGDAELIPFTQLRPDRQLLDERYAAAVRAVAAGLRSQPRSLS